MRPFKTLILLCLLTLMWGVCLTAENAFADSCPYCGRTYGEAAPGDEARVQALRQEHEANCPSRSSQQPSYDYSVDPQVLQQLQFRAKATEANERGNRYWKQGDYDKAIAAYQEALKYTPDDLIIKRNLAGATGDRYWAQEGDWDKAVAAYQEALRYTPNDSKVKEWLDNALKMQQNERGHRYFEQGDWDKAVAAYKEALKHAPNDSIITQNLAGALQQQKWAAEQRVREQQQREALRAAGENITRMLGNLAAQINRPSPSTSSSGLTFQGIDFDGRSGGAVGSKGAGASPSGGQIIDSSVVDLRDAKTLTVDPARVKGQPAGQGQGLDFMSIQGAGTSPSSAGLRDAPADQPAGQGQAGQTAPAGAKGLQELGTRLIKRGLYEDAVNVLNKALEAAPNDEGIKRALTRALILRDRVLKVPPRMTPTSPEAEEILLDAIEEVNTAERSSKDWDSVYSWLEFRRSVEKDPAKAQAINEALEDAYRTEQILLYEKRLREERDPAERQRFSRAIEMLKANQDPGEGIIVDPGGTDDLGLLGPREQSGWERFKGFFKRRPRGRP